MTEQIIPVENPPKVSSIGNRTTTGRKGNPNRYAYSIGRVQKMVRELVKTPNQWFIARKGATNRSSLAPTLSKYPQIHVATRKTGEKQYDIYVCYVPNADGSMDSVLANDIASWAERDELLTARTADETRRAESRAKRRSAIPPLPSDVSVPTISV